MKIEVMGTGCPKCEKTKAVIRKVLSELQLDAEIVEVKNITQIMERGVMITPAVFVDGVKVVAGKVPDEAEVKAFLKK